MVTVGAYRFLRGNRNRQLLPHRQMQPLRALLVSMAEFARGVAAQLDDDSRWLDAADALDKAAEALRVVAS